MYLLDTNVISELRKPAHKIDRHVARLIATFGQTEFFMSAISLMELEIGALRMSRHDTKQGAALRVWLDEKVIREFADRVLPVDAAVAVRCARLHVPDPASDRDALIAATALVHNLTVVTRNVAHFESTGVSLLNPWDEQP